MPWRSLPVRARPHRHAVRGHRPRRSAGAAHTSRCRPASATATQPGGGLPGSTAAFDAAFDPQEEWTRVIGSHWGEERQSQPLAQRRRLRPRPARATFASSRAASRDAYAPRPGRFYNRIFRSTQNFGEGIVAEERRPARAPGGSPDPQFLSPYQPYGLYIPDDYAAGHAGAAAAQRPLAGRQPERVPGGLAEPLQPAGRRALEHRHHAARARHGHLVHRLRVRGRARGVGRPAGRTTRSTTTRTSIGGYSMGGYMTYRMGLLMPDRFAAANRLRRARPRTSCGRRPLPPQPPSDYDVAGQTNNIVYERAEPAVRDQQRRRGRARAGRRRPRSRRRRSATPATRTCSTSIRRRDHFALILADEWGHTRDFLDQHPQRNLSPDEVRYKRYPSMDLPQHGLRFDGAYWVDGMAVRTPGRQLRARHRGVRVGVRPGRGLHARPRRRPLRTKQSTTAYPGPPFPATVQGTDRVPGAAIPQQNRFEASSRT